MAQYKHYNSDSGFHTDYDWLIDSAVDETGTMDTELLHLSVQKESLMSGLGDERFSLADRDNPTIASIIEIGSRITQRMAHVNPDLAFQEADDVIWPPERA